jgi:8-oxo-dGTP pyrophosphatase MutT (NUDIX family)
MSQKRERVSVICIHQRKILCFVAIDPSSGKRYYFLPGGGLEPGESEEACARRETLEETGYQVSIDPNSRTTRSYPFHWDGKDYECMTHFYRGHLAEDYHPPGPVEDQKYNKGPVWIPVGKIPAIFDYSLEILQAVELLTEEEANPHERH